MAAACSSPRADPPANVDTAVDLSVGPGLSRLRMSVEPQSGVRSLVRAIDRAQDRIFVETYILSDRRVIHALMRAAAQGVDVYALLEHHPLGMGTQPESVAASLRAAGVLVRWARPQVPLTHAKFMVLDDRLAVISTANLSRSAFTRNREFIVFDARRADVREVSNLFRADWDRVPAPLGDHDLVVSPGNARIKLTRLIRTARRRLDIYSEEMADPAIEQNLVRRARVGVQVRVILPSTGDLSRIGVLMSGGVQVRTLVSPYVHAKVVVADNRLAFVGSVNFSQQSLDRNRELGILIRGRSVSRLEKTFVSDWRRAKVVPRRSDLPALPRGR